MSIFETIHKFIKMDSELLRLLESAHEYAELYLNAKQRQKGCDGIGEVAMLKDDFIYYLKEMIRYCKEKGYLLGDISYEIDHVAGNISKTQPE